MKLNLFTTLALLGIISAAQAQHVNIGVKGGLNVFNIKGDASSGNQQKLGFNLGLLGHIHQGKRFALQPEVVYSVQGTKFKSNGDDIDVKLSYVNIPILFQYMFDNGFRLQAGPQLGILASARRDINGSSSNTSSNFKGTDLGLTMGLSYVKPSTGFGADVRYNLGLTDISTNNNINSYNRGVQLGVFYIFNQTHKHSDK